MLIMSQDSSKVEFLRTEQLDMSALDQIYRASVSTNISMTEVCSVIYN